MVRSNDMTRVVKDMGPLPAPKSSVVTLVRPGRYRYLQLPSVGFSWIVVLNPKTTQTKDLKAGVVASPSSEFCPAFLLERVCLDSLKIAQKVLSEMLIFVDHHASIGSQLLQ